MQTPPTTDPPDPPQPADSGESDSRQSFLTADLPGIGGILKRCPEDFLVEEVPAYLPTGEGEHLFLWIEKESLSTEQVTRHIARILSFPATDIGVAGLKDRRAITRQFLSIPARYESRVGQIATDGIRILDARRHPHKLRTGHLRGNRFSILVRDVAAGAQSRAEEIRRRVERIGFPNYFGSQRYGFEGETLTLGRHLLRGEKNARDLPASRRKFLLRLALSAVQSWLFDATLAARLSGKLLDTVIRGDVMQVAASGGPFIAEDLAREQERMERKEIVLTGPMFGPKMLQPKFESAVRESHILEQHRIAVSDFERYSKLTSGTRRSMVVHPADLQITPEADGLRFQFTLPSGAYATTVLTEFMKDEALPRNAFNPSL